jgi:hypothetical protein
MNQNPNPGIQFQTVSNGMSIFTDNLKIAKHMILTWQKKAQHIKLKDEKENYFIDSIKFINELWGTKSLW